MWFWKQLKPKYEKVWFYALVIAKLSLFFKMVYHWEFHYFSLVLSPLLNILFFVDVAERVFDKCINGNGLPVEHPQYEITCSYEFLEDGFTEWGQSVNDLKSLELKQQQQQQQQQHSNNFDTSLNISNVDNKLPSDTSSTSHSCFHSIGTRLHLPGYVKKQTEQKRNHPLKFMVSVIWFC